MLFLHNIRTVARYEAIILRRSWFFRLFSLGALFIFTILNIGLFSPVGDENWQFIAIPAAVPMFNLYLLNIAQAIVVIFLAADFLKRDKNVDTNEVLYTRSMSNFEYVIGKSWGILKLFIGLDLIILSIGLVMNIISKSMTVDLMSYVYYLLIICIPTILFSLGLAFMLMSVIRNQAITFLFLIGIAALDMFWLWYRAGSIFDYMAFGLPIFKSEIVGFDNLNLILNQRLLYLMTGLALILATVLLFKRLPQSRTHTSLTIIFMIIFLGSGVFCGINTYNLYKSDKDARVRVIEVNRMYEERNFVTLTYADIELRHTGNSIESSAKLTFRNDNSESLGQYLFSLNPGLEVSGIVSNGKNLNFKKSNHIIEIEPLIPLATGATDSLEINYKGSINESFCYPDHTDNLKETPYRLEMLSVNKRQAFLTPRYVLLTPEAHWYPVAGLNYYPASPANIKVDFTNYRLHVLPMPGLKAVAQGEMKYDGEYSVFTTSLPITGLTLAIGKYESDTLKVDSIRYLTYYLPGHDYYKKDLSLISDTLSLLVSGIMRELETSFSTRYPFKDLSLVEVPVQFYSYPRMSTQTRAELQPSMVLLPEKLTTIGAAGFRKRIERQKKQMARNNQVITDKELQVRVFNNFVRNTFISGENFRYINGAPINEPTRYRLGPSFYFFKNNFYSADYPVINAVFEAHLQKVVSPQAPGFMQETLTELDKANLILRKGSFREILAKNPGSDTIRALVTIKGDYLFNLFRSKAGIQPFREWFTKYLDDHKFQRIDITTFSNEMKEKFGFDFYPYLYPWFNMKEQPGFLFSDLQARETVVDNRMRYLVTFTVSNAEPVAGIFNVSFRTGGQGGGRGGRGNLTVAMQTRGFEISGLSRIFSIGPNEAKRIKVILDAQPRALVINTLFSKNIPGEITLQIDEIIKARGKITDNEGEEVLSELSDLPVAGEVIVDNEDPGFRDGNQVIISPLKRMLGIENNYGDDYQQMNIYWAPEYWQPVVQSAYHGKYVRSAVYTRSGTGDRSVKWSAPIQEPGYYNIYCYIGKAADRMMVRRAGGPGAGDQGGPPGSNERHDDNLKDMHYKVYHDEGIDEITVDFESADPEWYNLGQYYISSDTATVELTNQSAGRMVLGDAIRWARVN
jgi:hypothetical protein